MKYLAILLAIALLSFSFGQQDEPMEEIQNIINITAHNFAPDKRTAIFNISFEVQNSKVVLKGETNLSKAKESLIENLESSDFEIEDRIELLPSKELGENIYGVIDLSVSNLRTKPEHSAELCTQALLGTPVKIYKKRGYWYLVQTPDKYLGWVGADGFEIMNNEQLKEWNSSDKVIFIEEFGKSFSLESKTSVPVSDLVAGNILKKVGSTGNFVKVEYPDKRIAYVPKEKVKDYDQWLDNIEATGTNIISSAKSLIGTPYLWGGTSVKGMDCSGFTKTVFFLNGLLLPRDASQQVHTGKLITTRSESGALVFDDLKPGDLLFFGRKASNEKKERVTHVGIYIGNGEFIHSSGRVRINSLDKSSPIFNEYRFNTFLRAKRIIGSGNGILSVKENSYY